MKSASLISVFVVALIGIGCEPLGESTVSSPSDTPIYTTSITVDTAYVSGSSLYATRKVTNTGSSNISPPWYFEAQFYTSTHTRSSWGQLHDNQCPAQSGTVGVLDNQLPLKQRGCAQIPQFLRQEHSGNLQVTASMDRRT